MVSREPGALTSAPQRNPKYGEAHEVGLEITPSLRVLCCRIICLGVGANRSDSQRLRLAVLWPHVTLADLISSLPALDSDLTFLDGSYHVGVLSSVLVHPGFIAALNKPTAAQKGAITAVYYAGTWLSYIFLSHPVADRLGRRYAALVGIAIVAVGTAFEAGATAPGALAMMIIGRIISGIGVAILSTSVPLYQRFALHPRPIKAGARLIPI